MDARAVERGRDGARSARAWLWPVAIAVVAAAAYSSSFAGTFHWDEEDDLLRNPYIRQLSTAWNAPEQGGLVGRPIASLSFALNYAFGGLEIGGWHAVNLAIHVAAGWLVFAIARRTLALAAFSEHVRGRADGLSAAIASIWVAHPLHTQSITYVLQRIEALCGLLMLAALYAAIRAMADPTARRWTLASVASCWLAVGTKEVAVAAPLLVWIYDRTFVAGGFAAAWRARRGLYLGLFASWIPLAWLVVAASGRSESVGFGNDEVSVLRYLQIQAFALLTYLKLSVFPSPLVFDYGLRLHPPAWLWLCGGAAILAAVAHTARAVWRGRASGFALAWFFLILAPTSSVLPILTELVAEHRMYLPLAGPIALAVLWLDRAFSRWRAPSALAPALTCAIVVAFAATTFARNRDYEDPDGMWEDVVEKRPSNDRAQNNFGNCLRARGELERALAHYAKAAELAPHDVNWRSNLGSCLLELGDAERALAEFERILAIDRDHVVARVQRAKILSIRGDSTTAIDDLRALLARAPNLVLAHKELALALARAGRRLESVDHFHAALSVAPGDGELLFAYAWVLATAPEDELRSGERSLALIERLKPMRPKPSSDDLVLAAAALAEVGRAREAERTVEQAAALARAGAAPERLARAERAAELVRAGRKLREEPSLLIPPP